jgi:hypothetical protein
MADAIKACIDRLPPPPSRDERMALVKDAKWQPGDAIVVRFLDGDPTLHARVKSHASVWTQHANIRLYFREDPQADIRISFKQKGSWSHLGTYCRKVPADQPTMNYGWLSPQSTEDEVARVVLHEFGHALGCVHEHSNPGGGIKWKKEKVYEYFTGPPNNWTRAQVDRNLFQTYDKDLTLYSALDRASIMMYPIDPRFTEDGFSVSLNRELSATDKDFIHKMYP